MHNKYGTIPNWVKLYKDNSKDKRKSFFDCLGPEDHLQKAVFDYVGFKHPDILIMHPPNEGRRTPYERFKFKFIGGKPGVPDVFILKPNRFFCGLAMELKIKPNKATPSQDIWIKDLKAAGWCARVIFTIEEAIELIDNYLDNM